MAKVVPKVISLPKVIPQNCGFSKLLLKAACCSKLPYKATPQSRFCSPNLLRKVIFQSRSPKLLSKFALDSCSPKLLKLPPKIVSENYLPKLLSKAIVQSCRSSKQLFVNVAAKPQNCSSKLLPKPRSKETRQNSKAAPEAASKLVRKVVQGCSPRLLPKAVPRCCSPQSYSTKRLQKAAPQSCY